jgi:vacuolar protein sorting-associated protein 13A/C
VKVQSQPIQIVYDGETVIQLLKVFQTQRTATLSQLQDAAAEKLGDIKERSATGEFFSLICIKFYPSWKF